MATKREDEYLRKELLDAYDTKKSEYAAKDAGLVLPDWKKI